MVRRWWEVWDTLAPLRVEILLVSRATPTVTIRTPTYRAAKRGCVLPLIPQCLHLLTSPGLHHHIPPAHHDLLSNPILVLLSSEQVLVVIYYLILLPPLYWGHNATFTVENATCGPTGGKIGNIDHLQSTFIPRQIWTEFPISDLLILAQSIAVIGASYVLPEEYCGISQ